jgi:two-component system chemotaxis response regulator CheY
MNLSTTTVLIVDDYKTMRAIVRSLLTQIGFSVSNLTEADNGETALAKLHEQNFGLIISDWNMVPMSGLDLLRKVRSEAALKAIPFIMVTAESKPENVAAAKAAGVSNYIVKPFTAETLSKKLEAVMGPLK